MPTPDIDYPIKDVKKGVREEKRKGIRKKER